MDPAGFLVCLRLTVEFNDPGTDVDLLMRDCLLGLTLNRSLWRSAWRLERGVTGGKSGHASLGGAEGREVVTCLPRGLGFVGVTGISSGSGSAGISSVRNPFPAVICFCDQNVWRSDARSSLSLEAALSSKSVPTKYIVDNNISNGSSESVIIPWKTLLMEFLHINIIKTSRTHPFCSKRLARRFAQARQLR